MSYVAGSNVPGHLPFYEPEIFTDAKDALIHIKGLMREDYLGLSESEISENDTQEINNLKFDGNGELEIYFNGLVYFIKGE